MPYFCRTLIHFLISKNFFKDFIFMLTIKLSRKNDSNNLKFGHEINIATNNCSTKKFNSRVLLTGAPKLLVKHIIKENYYHKMMMCLTLL